MVFMQKMTWLRSFLEQLVYICLTEGIAASVGLHFVQNETTIIIGMNEVPR